MPPRAAAHQTSPFCPHFPSILPDLLAHSGGKFAIPRTRRPLGLNLGSDPGLRFPTCLCPAPVQPENLDERTFCAPRSIGWAPVGLHPLGLTESLRRQPLRMPPPLQAPRLCLWPRLLPRHCCRFLRHSLPQCAARTLSCCAGITEEIERHWPY